MKHIPEIFSLDLNKSYSSQFGGEEEITVQLLSYSCEFDKLFGKGKWYPVFRDAVIKVRINDNEHSIWCRPYQMPVKLEGIWIQADMLKDVLLGAVIKAETDKTVLFSASVKKWWEREEAVFPVEEYLWRSSIFRTHTWNGYVQLEGDGSIYYHAGEDFALQRDKHPLVSPVNGIVIKVPGPDGDGKSNSIIIDDETYSYRFAHCNAAQINSDLNKGSEIAKGDFVALTGNTWDGHPINDDHFHWGMKLVETEEPLNPFPFMVFSYLLTYEDAILPIAGGFRFCEAGDTVTHKADRTINPDNRSYTCTWILHTGEICEGESIDVCYLSAGSYCEILKITDENGREYYDTVLTRVTEEGSSGPPSAFINWYPARDITPGAGIDFYISYGHMKQPEIDFGDGTSVCDFSESQSHAYNESGTYIVTVTGQDTGSGPGIFRFPVIVK